MIKPSANTGRRTSQDNSRKERGKHCRFATMGMMLLFGLLSTATVQAQTLASADDARITKRIAERTALLDSVRNPIEALSSKLSVSPAWIAHVDQQFATSLRSPIEAVREQTLQDIIYIATFHSDTVSLKKVVSPLVTLYLFDKDERHRIMAVAALSALNDPYGIERLREEVQQERSARVQQVTLAALVDYQKHQSTN